MWTTGMENTFRGAKEVLVRATMLKCQVPSPPLSLHTDASVTTVVVMGSCNSKLRDSGNLWHSPGDNRMGQ